MCQIELANTRQHPQTNFLLSCIQIRLAYVYTLRQTRYQAVSSQEDFMSKFSWVVLATLSAPLLASASSHREAPNISRLPTLDATDLYMFNSYETGRAGYVTILANYIPLQDPYGGPNYFALDQAGLYEIKIDNNGDAAEDLTFQFQFTNTLANND